MKKIGSTLEFKAERNSEILKAYRQEAMKSETLSLRVISEAIVKYPQSRFWVSEERATKVVALMDARPEAYRHMSTPKQRMYAEIYRRVDALRQQRPGDSLVSLVRDVVYEPAPELYMEPSNVTQIIYAYWRAKRAAAAMGMSLRQQSASDRYERG